MSAIIVMCMNLTLAAANGIDCTAVPTTPPPHIEAASIFLTVYDTALCEEDEVCLQGNGDGYFASMIPVSDEWYGRMAACPPDFFGSTIQVLDMELYCGDNFGSLDGKPVDAFSYSERAGWYVRVDVFWPVAEEGHPNWNAWVVPNWSYSYVQSAN